VAALVRALHERVRMTHQPTKSKLVIKKLTLRRLDDTELNDVFGGACCAAPDGPGKKPAPSITASISAASVPTNVCSITRNTAI
jgi:hypothetical protein